MKILKEVLDWFVHIAIAVIVAFVITIFIAQPSYVHGMSMAPALLDQDKILVNKLPHSLKMEIDYGDIVIIDSRVDRERNFKDDIIDTLRYNLIAYKLLGIDNEIYWVKRVIGKSGDVFCYKDNILTRNGEVLDEPYIKETMEFFPEGNTVVPEGSVFVMGDNRNNSTDSRIIGCVPLDHVIGKLLIRF
ncbi:MAG TPA: signal peptidase I [Clostridia bacterium]|nr:signal peptidase I [Clostridia bacterium]